MSADDTDGSEGYIYHENHGTASIGVVGAADNGFGVVGMANEAGIKMAPHTTDAGAIHTQAFDLVFDESQAGDVLLLEASVAVCGADANTAVDTDPTLGPWEGEAAIFDAVQAAVAQGLVVISPAGNGNTDLDHSSCGNTFDRSKNDSGSIMVGSGNSISASTSPIAYTKRASSSYGDRLDIHAWGGGITTLGYGTHADSTDPDNRDFWYTDYFNGTSGASALTAGAVTQLQGIVKERFGRPLDSFQMRKLLNSTGDAQDPVDVSNGRVGPRVNIKNAIDSFTSADANLDIVFLVDRTGSYINDFEYLQNTMPNIVSTILSEHSNAQFALATFQDFPELPFGWAGGDFHDEDGSTVQVNADYIYKLEKQLTSDETEFLNAIDAIEVPHKGNGQDTPEAQLEALYRVANGDDNNEPVDFRQGAVKLIIFWTDAGFHRHDDVDEEDTDHEYPGTVSFEDAAAAILALDPPQVLGISTNGGGRDDLITIAEQTHSLAPKGGIDCTGDGVTDIPEGEPMVCTVVRGDDGITVDLPQAILNLVGSGVANRQADMSVQLDVASGDYDELPRFIRLGEEVKFSLNTLVANNGPSSEPVESWLELFVSGSEHIQASVDGGPFRFNDMVSGDETIMDQTITLSCVESGKANVTIEAEIELTSPADFYDPMPVNNNDRIAFSVECLPEIYATKALDIRNYTEVDASVVYGGNSFKLGTDATVTGDVIVNGDVNLWSRAHIQGDLLYAGNYVEQDGVEIDGEVDANQNYENLRLPRYEVQVGSTDKTVNNDSADNWAPGSYRYGMVRARGTLVLTAGDYYFEGFKMEPNSKLVLNTSGGEIRIFAQGELEFGDRAIIEGGNHLVFSVYSNTTNTARFGTDLDFPGAILVPNGTVHAYSRTSAPAHIWSKYIILEPDVDVQ